MMEAQEMDSEAVSSPQKSGNILVSILAVFAGFVFAAVTSVGTDVALHKAGIAPDLSEHWPDKLLAVATLYRTIYGVISSWITARLAPKSPMGHALIGGAIGTALAIAGVIVNMQKHMGADWYPIALAILAMPTAWLGGKLRLMQLDK
jgi:hypothetical protein